MFVNLIIIILAEAVLAVILTSIEAIQGSIYHATFWEEVLMNFAVLFLGSAPVLFLFSK
jgi:hypothetical protein